MTPRLWLISSCFVALETALTLPAWPAPAQKKAAGGLDTAKIEELTGEKGTMDPKAPHRRETLTARTAIRRKRSSTSSTVIRILPSIHQARRP
jgi:hypothetical protein